MSTAGPSPLGPSVVSPYLASDPATRIPVQRPVDVPGASLSADQVMLTTGPCGVEAADAPAGQSRWSLLIACVATACSLIGPSPLAAAPVQASVGVSLAGGASEAASPSRLATATRATRSQDAVIEHMLSPLPGHAPLPEGIRQQVAATLRTVPPEVLRVLDANGTRITMVAEGESPLEAGIVGPIDLQQAYADPAALAERAQQALSKVDAAFAKRIAAQESRVRAAEKKEKASGRTGFDAESKRLDLLSLRSDRDATARRAVQEATDGLVDPATQGTAGFLPGAGGNDLLTTLREMARAHGAVAPGEAEEFIGVVQRLNGERVSQAQVDYQKVAPAGSQAGPAAFEDRPFLANAANILVPAYEYHRPSDAPEAKPILLRTHDAQSVTAWHDGGVVGQCFYQDHRQTVAMGARAFNGRENAPHVLLHELGHAFEDAARRQGGPAYEQFRQERDQAFSRLEANPRHPFAFAHSGSSATEMTAETFAVTTEKSDAALRKADPKWVQAFERMEKATNPQP